VDTDRHIGKSASLPNRAPGAPDRASVTAKITPVDEGILVRRIAKKFSASILIAGAMVAAAPTHTAVAAQATPPIRPGVTGPIQPGPPPVQRLDCVGGTGIHGCGPGWIWHDGWRGWACYVC
jgi:hypothetical protein